MWTTEEKVFFSILILPYLALSLAALGIG